MIKQISMAAIIAMMLAGCAVATDSDSARPVETAPVAGADCQRLGKSVEVGTSTFECRYAANMNLQWHELLGATTVPASRANLVDWDTCRIEDQRPKDGPTYHSGSTSFPFRVGRMNYDGKIDIALIPIDYPNRESTKSPLDLLKPEMEAIDSLVLQWSGGIEQIEWHLPASWLRMPKEAENYALDHKSVQGDGSLKADSDVQLLSAEEQAFDVFSAAEQEIDLSKIDFGIIVSNPQAREVAFGPASHERSVITAEGVYDFPYFGLGSFVMNDGRAPWTFMLHELLHFRGVAGHAPGNEVPYNLMSGGESLTFWDAFILGWHKQEQVACLDASAIDSEKITIGSMDLPQSGVRGIVIRLDDQRVLVVESRRKNEFNYSVPKGFAGVQVYLVDSSKEANRFDGNVEREKDYFAYYLRIDGLSHHEIPELQNYLVPGYSDLNETAFQGDSFTFEGLRISVAASGDFDEILVERLK